VVGHEVTFEVRGIPLQAWNGPTSRRALRGRCVECLRLPVTRSQRLITGKRRLSSQTVSNVTPWTTS